MKKPKYISDFAIIFIILIILLVSTKFIIEIINNPNFPTQGIIAIISFDIFLIVALASIISIKKQNKYFFERFNVLNTSFLINTAILTIIAILFTNFSNNLMIFLNIFTKYLFTTKTSGDLLTILIIFSIVILFILYSKMSIKKNDLKALTKSIFSLIGIFLFGIIIFLFGTQIIDEFLRTNNTILLITFALAIFQFFTLFATILSTYFKEVFKDNIQKNFFFAQLIIGIIILITLTINGNNGLTSLITAITYSGLINIFRKEM